MKEDIQYLINKNSEGELWNEDDIKLLEHYSNLKNPDIMFLYGQYIFYTIDKIDNINKKEQEYDKAINLIIESEKLGCFNSQFLIDLIVKNCDKNNCKNDRYNLFRNNWRIEYLKVKEKLKN